MRRSSPTCWSIRKARCASAATGSCAPSSCSSRHSLDALCREAKRRSRALRAAGRSRSGLSRSASTRCLRAHQGRRAASLSSLPAPASFWTWLKLSARALSRRRWATWRSIAILFSRAQPRSPTSQSRTSSPEPRPVSLYLVIPPEEISRLKALLAPGAQPDPETPDRDRIAEHGTGGASS
jgi:hypothetical protein